MPMVYNSAKVVDKKVVMRYVERGVKRGRFSRSPKAYHLDQASKYHRLVSLRSPGPQKDPRQKGIVCSLCTPAYIRISDIFLGLTSPIHLAKAVDTRSGRIALSRISLSKAFNDFSNSPGSLA